VAGLSGIRRFPASNPLGGITGAHDRGYVDEHESGRWIAADTIGYSRTSADNEVDLAPVNVATPGGPRSTTPIELKWVDNGWSREALTIEGKFASGIVATKTILDFESLSWAIPAPLLMMLIGLHPDRPARAGSVRRREFEYKRHGTAKLMAALDITTGQVLAETIEHNDAVTFIGFLESIDSVTDPNLGIHVVLDNGSSHVAKLTRAWLDAHPRWHAHFTPKHASWVNQIELFFSILQRKVIRNGNFASRDDLIAKILKFITDYDQTARPFAWTYAADPLKIG
jgi:transposase